MRISKIGSVNTYVKCLKDLDAWQYIRYMPSFNPQRGSKVHLYRFDKGTDKADSKADDTTADKAGEQPVSPSINILNNANIENREKDIPPAHDTVREFFKSKNASETEAEKFFAHYKANGWRLSGRTPMQDWQAAATKWILNINSFTHERTPKPRLDTSAAKDYSEPL